MKVQIKSIVVSGLDEERVTLEILNDCDIGHYFILDSTYTDNGKVSNKVRHTYWFPDKTVKTGDFVWLYTKEGKQTEHKNTSNTTTHVFYWGLKSQLWNDKKDCAILVEANAWQYKDSNK